MEAVTPFASPGLSIQKLNLQAEDQVRREATKGSAGGGGGGGGGRGGMEGGGDRVGWGLKPRSRTDLTGRENRFLPNQARLKVMKPFEVIFVVK
jgi:hypothetical protein